VARVVAALARTTPTRAERDEPFKEAAVALVLHPLPEGQGELLVIRRAIHEGDPWSGQAGLPGGRLDTRDDSLESAALRETLEEVGLDLRAHGHVLGELDELRPRTPVLPPIIVRPYVCIVAEPPPLVLSAEVAEARWIDVARIFRPETRITATVTGRNYRMQAEAYQVDDLTIWGMTERILSRFGELIL
jgi:8-oxo-dGTP pyrophosphatase MutT (NUDIX family)